MNFHLRHWQEVHVDRYAGANVEHTARDGKKILQLVIPEPFDDDIFGIFGIILAGACYDDDVPCRSQFRRESTRSVYLSLQAPGN